MVNPKLSLESFQLAAIPEVNENSNNISVTEYGVTSVSWGDGTLSDEQHVKEGLARESSSKSEVCNSDQSSAYNS